MTVARHQCPACHTKMTRVHERVTTGIARTHDLGPDGWKTKVTREDYCVDIICGHCQAVIDSTSPEFEMLNEELPVLDASVT